MDIRRDGGSGRAGGRHDLGAHEGGPCGCQEAWREAWWRPGRTIDGKGTSSREGRRTEASAQSGDIQELQAAGCESLWAIAPAWRSAVFLRHAAASGLLSKWRGCWRPPPSLSTAQASSPRET